MTTPTEQKKTDVKPEKKKGGRPAGYSPKAKQMDISISVDGDEVIIRMPKKELSRKILADLI